jgi:hypothetical protein
LWIDALSLNEDADTDKLTLLISNEVNCEVWVSFILAAVDAELCKAVTDVLVEDV